MKEPSAAWSINRDAHQPPKSPYWFACFTDCACRRVRRSTKTTDRTLAGKLASEWAELAQAGRAGRLTESQCRSVIADLYEQVHGEPLHFRSCRDYVTEWLEERKAEVDLKTYARYGKVIH